MPRYQEFESESKKGTGTGRVMLRDILNGFAQVLATTASDQASFFFDYYGTRVPPSHGNSAAAGAVGAGFRLQPRP